MVNFRKTVIGSIVVAIALTLAISCHPRQSVISRFSDIHFDDKSDVMDLCGFYQDPNPRFELLGYNVKTDCYIFYPDHTVCAFSLNEDSVAKYDVKTSLSHCVQRWGRKKRKWGGAWGVYRKQGDHIYTELFDNIYLLTGPDWSITKREFVIKGDSLIQVNCMRLDQSGQKYREWNGTYYVYIFVPVESFPEQPVYAHSIKKRKWRWRNSKNWETYMKQYNSRQLNLP